MAIIITTADGTPAHDLMLPREAAEVFRVTRFTLSRWQRAGYIDAVWTPGRQRRYRRADVEQLLRSLTLPAAGR